MASIQPYTTARGQRRYRVFIRRKGHRPVTRVFDKKKSAEEYVREHDTEVKLREQDRLALGRQHSVKDLVDRYLKGYEGRDAMRGRLLAWWVKTLGERRIAEVTPEVVADALDGLRHGKALKPRRAGQATESERTRSESTVNRYHSALSSVFQAAIRGRWGWVVENPCRAVGRGKEGPGRVRFLSEDEVRNGTSVKGERTRLLKACRSSEWPHLHLLVSLALSTGARRGELLHLCWRDVDLARGVAYLRTSKNEDPRALPLVPPVLQALKQARKRAEGVAKAAASGAKGGEVRDIQQDRIFRSDGDPAKAYSIDKPWREALKAAGVEGFRFHDLRHSAASYLAMNGATLLEIADVLGHRTLAMVRRYSHLSHAHKAKLLNRVMPKLVGGARSR